MTKNKNPMKPSTIEPEFINEKVEKLGAELAEKHGFDLEKIEGSGADGVITEDDLQLAVTEAIKAAEDDQKGDEDLTIYASKQAEAFAEELLKDETLSIEDIKAIKGKGNDGAITKDDLKNAISEPEEDANVSDSSEEDANVSDSSEEDEEDEEDEKIELDTKEMIKLNEKVIDGLISMLIPVRGALNAKPKVQQAWNELGADAVKLKKFIVAYGEKNK